MPSALAEPIRPNSSRWCASAIVCVALLAACGGGGGGGSAAGDAVSGSSGGPIGEANAPPPSTASVDALTEPPGVRYVGPIRITRGGTYSGNWRSDDPAVPAVLIDTLEPVVIERSSIVAAGDLIVGFRSRLTVRDTFGRALNPNVAGRSPGRFLRIEDFQDVRVENNDFTGTSGIYFRAFVGDSQAGDGVRVLRNRARDVDGRHSDGAGGFGSGYDLRQFVQLNALLGLPNIQIAWNEVINTPGASRVEDNISMFNSGGTADSPARIHDNYIQGAYPFPIGAPYNGGGIMLGDTVSGTAFGQVPAFVWAYDNQVVSVMGHGMAIAAGNNHRMFRNRVVTSGLLADGSIGAGEFTVGIYVWEYLNDALRAVFFANVASDNVVATYQRGAGDRLVRNDFFFRDCVTSELPPPSDGNLCLRNTSIAAPVTLATERAERDAWRAKLAAQGVVIGIRR